LARVGVVWISAFCAGVLTNNLYGCGGDVAWLRILDDFVNVTGCKWLLEFGNGALGLSIAAFKLWDRLAVYVVGVCERECLGVGGRLLGRRFGRRLGWFLCLEA
jgi:hypothetical protein